MLGELSLIMVIIAVVLVIVNATTGKIPKTGRDGAANGERITAKITNKNKYADRVTTLRAESNGRKFKVKMKPTEANLWVKGDSIDIILGNDKKSYRICFNDYFRQNEARLRGVAVKMLEKVRLCNISSRLVGYKKEMELFLAESKLTSKQLFSFVTYMKLIDIYSVLAVILTALVVVWKIVISPSAKEFILPLVMIIIVMYAVYVPVGICKRLIKEASKS